MESADTMQQSSEQRLSMILYERWNYNSEVNREIAKSASSAPKTGAPTREVYHTPRLFHSYPEGVDS